MQCRHFITKQPCTYRRTRLYDFNYVPCDSKSNQISLNINSATLWDYSKSEGDSFYILWSKPLDSCGNYLLSHIVC